MATELWGKNAAPIQWEVPSSFSIGYPTAGDLRTNTHPTHIGSWWFDSMAMEIRTVIEKAGLVYDPTNPNQLLQAIQELVSPTFELREDGSYELREDRSFELRQ